LLKLIIAALLFTMPAAVHLMATGLATPRPWSDQILVPAAISAAGANDTWFRSDIRLTNMHFDRSQRVSIQWLPAGGGAIAAFVTEVTLEGGSSVTSNDFVREVMNRGGLGAIVFQGLTADGAPDPHARLHATSRIWTHQPGSDGTSSQTLTPVPFRDVVSEHVVILGHQRNEHYRTNVGIVNLDATNAQTFLVTVSGENPTLLPEIYRVTVPPLAMIQFPTSGAEQNQLRVDIEQERLPGQGRLTLWTAYASSVDNITGDGWSSVGVDVSE
jgi:hypothetical protein